MMCPAGKAVNVYAIFACAATAVRRRPAVSARGIEGVDDVARHFSGRDQDHVEADGALGVVGVVREPEFGGG